MAFSYCNHYYSQFWNIQLFKKKPYSLHLLLPVPYSHLSLVLVSVVCFCRFPCFHVSKIVYHSLLWSGSYMVFSRLITIYQSVFKWLDTTTLVYYLHLFFFCFGTLGLFLPFGYYKWSFHEYFCTRLCGLPFSFSWVYTSNGILD